MAGTNLVLKEDQVLFKEGDSADGMYLVRKGELRVYLEKDGNEVKLAHIGSGGMIGEMAFFDQKPRSASVKAQGPCEVTKITPQDFAKLMRQIPKWFVSIMSALSTRLRETNDRLQKVENQAAGAKSPFEDVIKILHVLTLVWHKEGIKEGKNWCLNRKTAEEAIKEIFAMDENWITEFLDTLLKLKFFTVSADNYKNSMLTIPNKGTISKMANFIRAFVNNYPSTPFLPPDAIEMLQAVNKLAQESAYDAVNISFEDVAVEGERQSFKTGTWNDLLKYFKKPADEISLIKVSTGVGFKVDKNNLPKYIDQHKIMTALAQAGLN